MGTHVVIADVLEAWAEHPGPPMPDLAQQVRFLVQSQVFADPHVLPNVVLRWLLAPPVPGSPRPVVSSAVVRLHGADTDVRAVAADQRYLQETNPWGTVDIIAEVDHAGLYRLNMAPGKGIPHHIHRHMNEHELVLTDGLIGWQGTASPRRLALGEHRRWAHGLPHGYHNRTPHVASVLCIDQPRFDPADEIPVDGGPDRAALEAVP